MIEEISKIDGTSPEQMWCFPVLNKALVRKVEVEEQTQQLAEEVQAAERLQLANEFLVTKTVSNKEVRENVEDWTESIKAEYEQLAVNKKAVKPMSRSQLQKMADEQGRTLEILPAKMVRTRKAGTGAYRSRAAVCGNYQTPNDDNTYAGGADGTQIRTMLGISAQYRWRAASTDIRTAFLNAPRHDDSRLIAMEVPHVYNMLGLAKPDEVWLIVLAMYGLQASPRDWCLHRDATLPTLKWTRNGPSGLLTGSFERTRDENVWRLEELDESGYVHWNGLMSVYVVRQSMVRCELFLKFGLCLLWNGLVLTSLSNTVALESPRMPTAMDFMPTSTCIEQEMLQRWNINGGVEYPHYKVAEDQEVEEDPDPGDIKTAQALAGSLLWLSSRTRPDLAHGVATMSQLMTKALIKAIQIGTTLMKYVKGSPGVELRYYECAWWLGCPWSAEGKEKRFATGDLLRHCLLSRLWSQEHSRHCCMSWWSTDMLADKPRQLVCHPQYGRGRNGPLLWRPDRRQSSRSIRERAHWCYSCEKGHLWWQHCSDWASQLYYLFFMAYQALAYPSLMKLMQLVANGSWSAFVALI